MVRTAFSLCVSAACLLVAVPGDRGAVWAADLDEIQSRGTLRVVCSRDEQPEIFTFRPAPGVDPGFERELIDSYARLHRVKVETIEASMAERLDLLVRGEADIAVAVVVTPARKEKVNFTRTVLPVWHVVVSRKPNRVVASVEEFRTEKVGVVTGSSWALAAQEAGVPPSEARGYQDLKGVLDGLRSEEITATVLTVTDFTLAAKRDSRLQAGVFVGSDQRAAWAVRKQDDQLEASVNQFLENSEKSITWNRLLVRYFGEQVLAVLGRR